MGLEVSIQISEEFTDFLSEFLKSSGTGINSIGVKEIDFDFDSYFSEMPADEQEEIRQDLIDNSLVMVYSDDDDYLLLKKVEDNIRLVQLTTNHQNEAGELIGFSFDKESEGTQRLIHLIPALFLLKEKNEKVIFIDELDRRLHPLLSRRFLEFCLQYFPPGDRNQLIFTTHDTNLLNLDILRRDEIWFVEKDLQGSSSLYSLAEFKIRPDLKVDKGYLNGRFGAIPFFGNVDQLGWLDPVLNNEPVKS